jgi:tetraacyldisaccharide 4'-kinase
VHRVERRIVGVRDLEGRTAAPPPLAFLLAAVARPERFERDVARAGSRVVGRAFFRDHRRLRADELQAVLDSARQAGADAIVTTAKDAVRLPPNPRGLPLLVLEIAAEIQDEARFRARLLSAVARRAA